MNYEDIFNSMMPVKDVGKEYRFIDLFAGIGGFNYALSRLGASCVLSSEIDKNARKTYQANHSTPIMINDVNDIKDIENGFDILCGGFPCQPFSNSGKKLGFEDTRGTLFFEIARILKTHQPKAAILENVRGLLIHNNGETMKVILNVLDDIGYAVSYKLLKSKDYGVPQNRPRIYFVLIRKDLVKDPFKFPEEKPLFYTMSDIFDGSCDKDVGYSLRVGGRNSGLGNRHNWDSYLVNGKERKISIKEAIMLQGFPPDLKLPVSESAAFKQLGNSITVPVAYFIAEALFDYLNK